MRHEPSSGYEDPSLNYRVTWMATDGSREIREQVFTSRDQGWDFFQDQKRSLYARDVTWDHIPAQ